MDTCTIPLNTIRRPLSSLSPSLSLSLFHSPTLLANKTRTFLNVASLQLFLLHATLCISNPPFFNESHDCHGVGPRYGCYEAVESGSGDESLRALTGQRVETVQLENRPGSKAPVDRDVAWARLLSFREAGFIMAASCGLSNPSATASADFARKGLVQNHAYTVVNVIERGGNRLMQLRNPWASGRGWRGDWSDGWPGWARHPDLRDELCPSRESSGVFWMSFEDFCQHFSAVQV